MRNLYVYNWRDIPNFGDKVSYYVVFGISKSKISWKDPRRTMNVAINEFYSDIKKMRKFKVLKSLKHLLFQPIIFPWQRVLFAVGSILDWANKFTYVWGSGYREPTSISFPDKVYAVRGYLSLSQLPEYINKDQIAVGDPAILLPLLYFPNVPKTRMVSIIPHFREYDYFFKKYGDRITVADVTRSDIEKLVDIIIGSKYILSSSLHGIIVAHAYGVPALWIKHGYVYSSDYKYLDYFSSVNIAYSQGLSDTDLEHFLSSDNGIIELFAERITDSVVDQSVISKIQSDLLRSFPFELKDKFRKFLDSVFI